LSPHFPTLISWLKEEDRVKGGKANKAGNPRSPIVANRAVVKPDAVRDKGVRDNREKAVKAIKAANVVETEKARVPVEP
jgi:hypothetical protein